MKNDKVFLDSHQTQNALLVSKPSLFKLIKKGSLTPINFEGTLFFRKAEVKTFKKTFKRSVRGRKRKEVQQHGNY